MEETRYPRQRSASLEQDTRQPRLAIEADVTSDKKTRKRTEDAAAAERVISGDSSSVTQVDLDHRCLTSFGDDFSGPPALPCSRNDALVDNGTAASKPCLSPVEMLTLTAAGGLFSAGKAATAMMAIFYQLPL